LKIDLIAPVSAMLVTSTTQTKAAQPGTQNANTEFPQQVSLFLGEAITPNLGTFLQFTYDAVGGSFHIDNADIRYANKRRLGSKEWRGPFISFAVAPSPAAAPLLDGALAQRVAGLGGYGLWDNRVYGEFSVYRPAPVAGSRSGRPNSTGLIGEVDFLPWWNTRFALQYVTYARFNGSHDDYDGFGRSASDNNTLYVLMWLVF